MKEINLWNLWNLNRFHLEPVETALPGLPLHSSDRSAAFELTFAYHIEKLAKRANRSVFEPVLCPPGAKLEQMSQET